MQKLNSVPEIFVRTADLLFFEIADSMGWRGPYPTLKMSMRDSRYLRIVADDWPFSTEKEIDTWAFMFQEARTLELVDPTQVIADACRAVLVDLKRQAAEFWIAATKSSTISSWLQTGQNVTP